MYYAIVESATGRLRSITERDPGKSLPAGMEVKSFDEPPRSNELWDEASKSFIAQAGAPDRDLAVEIASHPLIPSTLSSLTRGRIQDAAADVLDRLGLRYQ